MSGRAPDESADTALFVPYVVCGEHGGPFDAASFDAGVVSGMLYAELSTCERLGATPAPRLIARALAPQIDLFAMRFGYLLRTERVDDELVRASFARPDEIESVC